MSFFGWQHSRYAELRSQGGGAAWHPQFRRLAAGIFLGARARPFNILIVGLI